METTVEKPSKQIRELVIMNNDRYEGYKTAASETKDSELKSLFNTYSNQSKEFSEELEQALPDHKFTPEKGETKTQGKLYRVFMDIKSALTGNDRKGILSSCETGEDQIKKAYDEVLQDPEDIDSDTLEIIQRHRDELQKSHDKIKSMRDSSSKGDGSSMRDNSSKEDGSSMRGTSKGDGFSKGNDSSKGGSFSKGNDSSKGGNSSKGNDSSKGNPSKGGGSSWSNKGNSDRDVEE